MRLEQIKKSAALEHLIRVILLESNINQDIHICDYNILVAGCLIVRQVMRWYGEEFSKDYHRKQL